MEHMFMQIFERRDWIAGQLRQQEESYAQSVASNLLAAGGRLPSWLWNAAAGPDAWNNQRPQGLNREKTIPEILYNLPHFTTPMNHTTYPSQSFPNGKYGSGVHHILPHNDEETCIVMDSYDRMQEFSMEHKNKKMKHCDTQKNIIEYSGRMTRSKVATSMNTHKNDDHLRKQKRHIEYSGRMTRSKVAKSMNTEKNDDHLRNQRSDIKCSNRITRSKMATSMNTEKSSDHLRNQRSDIECSSRITRSDVVTSVNTQKNDDQLRNRSGIECSRRLTISKVETSVNTERNDDLLRNWSGVEYSSTIRRSKVSTLKNLNITGPLELKNLTGEDLNNSQNSHLGNSAAVRSTSLSPAEGDRSNIIQANEFGSFSKALEQIQRTCTSVEEEMDAGSPCNRNPSAEECQMAEEEEMEVGSPCHRNPSPELQPREKFLMTEEGELEVGISCHRSPSADLHPDDECRIAEEEEMEVGSLCHRNPSTERCQMAEEEEMEFAVPCLRNPSMELGPREECEMAEEGKMEVVSPCHRNPSAEKCQSAEEEEMKVASLCHRNLSTELHPREECEMVEGDCHQRVIEERVPDSPLQDVFEDNPLVDISFIRKVNESTGSVVTDDTRITPQNGTNEATIIKRIVEEKNSNEKMNSPTLLPSERFSYSCDSSMAISEDTVPELEGFSVEKPVMEDGFTFDLLNLAKSGLEGIPIEEMKDARGLITYKKECSIDEDAEMICNDTKESEVLEKELISEEESLEIEDVQGTSTVECFDSTCIDSAAIEAESNEYIISYPYDGRDGVIGNATAPEFEGFSIENPILMSGLIFDDPNLQKLSRERSSLLKQLQRSMNKQDLISSDLDGVCPNLNDQDTLESAISWVNEGALKPSNMEIGADVAKSTEEIESQTLLLNEANTRNTLPAGFYQSRVDNSDDYSLKRKFASRTLPLSSSQFGQRTSKPPFTPPIEKLQQKAFVEREKNHTGLSCFPIYENSKSLKGSTYDTEFRVNREPLTDVTSSYQNSSPVVLRSAKKLDGSALRLKISDMKKLDNKKKMSMKGQTVLEKKTTNIVSNIHSFIPLVRQKQQALAPATGKREVKVKALEAAEAAKRLAEKKETERRMKKEALKIERMKSEQENARQLELKQKQKEEERKKKEAAAAARKRQREEEMREKQRKKNCTEGAHRRAAEERECRKKPLSDEAVQDREKPIRSSSCLLQNRPSSCLLQNRRSQSYEISPYRDSDDDELQDDKRHRKKKFVPSWVRRESLDGHLLSMREMDPGKIFSRKASFSISEVLPYRTRMQLL